MATGTRHVVIAKGTQIRSIGISAMRWRMPTPPAREEQGMGDTQEMAVY
jgi:hypothetical protein